MTDFALTALGAEILEELKHDPPPPAYALAAALAVDNAAEAFASVVGHARRAAQATVDEAVERWVRQIAHEFRNKLAALKLAVGFVKEAAPASNEAGKLADRALPPRGEH